MSDVLSRERALDLKIAFHRLGIASPKDQGIKGHNEKKKRIKNIIKITLSILFSNSGSASSGPFQMSLVPQYEPILHQLTTIF